MNLRERLAKTDVLEAARWLVIVEVLALFVSTSLTSVAEVLLFAAVLAGSRGLAGRAREVIRQPAMIMTLLFAAFLFLGLLYGPAEFSDKLAVLKGWHKLALLPVGLLLFEQPLWKGRLILALLAAALLGGGLSFAGMLWAGQAVVVHNHAIQGIFFSAAAFAAVVCAFHPRGGEIFPHRWLLLAGTALLVANVTLITPGRGGYLVLLVLSLVAALSLARGWKRFAMTVAAPLLVTGLLLISPVASQRMEQGMMEMHGYRQAEEYTSMGIRMVMWENTLRLIREKPLLGYGLGGLKEAYRPLVAGVEGWKGIVIDDPHNQFLKITAELGLVGLAAFLGLLAALFCQKVAGVYRILGLGALLAWTASSLFAGHFATWAEGRFILIWAGSMLAMPSGQMDETDNQA